MKSADERDSKGMEEFRKQLVELFLDRFGKSSPNATAVRTTKAVFPNHVNLEKDPEHQKVFRDIYKLCPSLTMHISHFKAAAKAVHEDHGLKGILLDRKVEHDAAAAREALTKLQGTKYNWQRSEHPRMTAWQKVIFESDEEAEQKKGAAPASQKEMPQTVPTGSGPQHAPNTSPSGAGAKVKIYISSMDFKTTITVNCKPSSSMQDLVRACQGNKHVFQSCIVFKEAGSGRVVNSCADFVSGGSYLFVEAEDDDRISIDEEGVANAVPWYDVASGKAFKDTGSDGVVEALGVIPGPRGIAMAVFENEPPQEIPSITNEVVEQGFHEEAQQA